MMVFRVRIIAFNFMITYSTFGDEVSKVAQCQNVIIHTILLFIK